MNQLSKIIIIIIVLGLIIGGGYFIITRGIDFEFGLARIFRTTFRIPNIYKNRECNDSDSGINYYVKGNVKLYIGLRKKTYHDKCSGWGEFVKEYYCKRNRVRSKIYDCAKENMVCKDGACVKDKATACTDSDNGKNYYIKGNIYGNFQENPAFEDADFCSLYNASTGEDARVEACEYLPLNHCSVREYYCASSLNIGLTINTCKAGCKDGACLACIDFDNGKDYYEKSYIINKEGIRSDDECNPGPDTTENTLLEYYCTGNLQEPVLGIKYECPYGCQDGACISRRAMKNM